MEDSARLSLSEIRGPITDLLSKLDGEQGEVWLWAFKKFLRKENPWGWGTADSRSYSLTVDYGKPLEELVAEATFDWASAFVSSAFFPRRKDVRRTRFLEAFLIGFNREVSCEDAKMSILGMGLTPATAFELAAFAGQYPEMQQKFFIVALGKTVEIPLGGSHVPELDGNDGGRNLGIMPWKGERSPDKFRFLAFRVVS